MNLILYTTLRCTAGAPRYDAPPSTQGAAAGDPFRQSIDQTIGAGQNDGEDEQKLVLPWTIISNGHHAVRAVSSVVRHIFSHVSEQQWPANVFKILTTGHEQQQTEAPFHLARDDLGDGNHPSAPSWQQTVFVGTTDPSSNKGTDFKTLGQQFDPSDNRTQVWANQNHSKDRWPTWPVANPNPPFDITSRSSSPDQRDRVKQQKPIQTKIPNSN
ncbi:hypothetical protein ACLOJK_037565 [Asimina triloba]